MQKFSQLVQRHRDLQAMVDTIQQHTTWQQCWRSANPELAAMSDVCAIENQTLVIVAASGAVAHKIRLQSTQLLHLFMQSAQKTNQIKGLNLNAIKVKVQVKSPPARKHKRIAPLSPRSLQSLEQFANQLDDSALKQALNSLVTRQRSNPAHTR